jgi:hypothetical protein
MLSSFGLLGIAIDDPCDLLIENAVMDVGLLGMKVFIK